MALKEDPRIPAKFRKGKVKPATNVGELIKQLQELPPDLAIFHGFGNSVKVSVSSIDHDYFALLLSEIDDD